MIGTELQRLGDLELVDAIKQPKSQDESADASALANGNRLLLPSHLDFFEAAPDRVVCPIPRLQ